MKRDILLIPGLGGPETIQRLQNQIDRLNKRRTAKIHVFIANWETSETFSDKYSRLRTDYEALGKPPVLYGISAGGPLAVLLGAEHRHATIVTVAGKLKGSRSIGKSFKKSAPALLEAVQNSETLLNTNDEITSRLVTYRPILFDGVVPRGDMTVKGAKKHLIPVPLHTPSIAASLVTVLPRL